MDHKPGIHLPLLASKSFRMGDSVCYITAVFKVYRLLMPNICESTAFSYGRKEPPRVTTAFPLDYTRQHRTLWSVKRSKSSIKWHVKTSILLNVRLDIPLTAHGMWSQLFFLPRKPHTSATCKWCEEITDLRRLSNGHGQRPIRSDSTRCKDHHHSSRRSNNISGTQKG